MKSNKHDKEYIYLIDTRGNKFQAIRIKNRKRKPKPTTIRNGSK